MSEEVDIKFLKEAYKEALKAYSIDEVPVGAVVVIDGTIIGRGYNRRIKENNAILHAEVVAIQDACKNIKNWRLDGATIYITNEPCLMCAGAIMHARIRRVVFGSLNEKMGAILSNFRVFDDNNTPYTVEYRYIEDKNASQILKDYFSVKRGRENNEKSFTDCFYNRGSSR
ncbi:nucleoside deaminase [Persephonella hydrogeniphila]|nr:nucleoside deaminase [Persephonella hydrogeniphila]